MESVIFLTVVIIKPLFPSRTLPISHLALPHHHQSSSVIQKVNSTDDTARHHHPPFMLPSPSQRRDFTWPIIAQHIQHVEWLQLVAFREGKSAGPATTHRNNVCPPLSTSLVAVGDVTAMVVAMTMMMTQWDQLERFFDEFHQIYVEDVLQLWYSDYGVGLPYRSSESLIGCRMQFYREFMINNVLGGKALLWGIMVWWSVGLIKTDMICWMPRWSRYFLSENNDK